MNLEIAIIRMMWTLVDKSNPSVLLQLSDHELNQRLVNQIDRVCTLTPEVSQTLSQYINSRIMLIRDLAYAKVD